MEAKNVQELKVDVGGRWKSIYSQSMGSHWEFYKMNSHSSPFVWLLLRGRLVVEDGHSSITSSHRILERFGLEGALKDL